MKKSLLAILLTTLFVLSGCMQTASESKASAVSEDEIGLRNTSLYNEEDLELSKPLDYVGNEPGVENAKYERAFENAPPMIPHSVDGLLPITANNNMCISCHLPDVAEMVGAIPVPISHLYDLRNDKDLGGTLSNARFNCSQCHAPQAKRDPLVQNRFNAAWRTKEGAEKSNLMDVLGDGVK